MSNFDFAEMLRSMGMNPENLNKNQKDIVDKAQEKVEKREDSEDWMKEKYGGLFPNWKK